MADASREDVPGGVRSGGDSLENGSKVSSDVTCPGMRGVRVPRYPVVILAVVVQHGAAAKYLVLHEITRSLHWLTWRRRPRRASDDQCSVMPGHSQYQSFMEMAVSANIGRDA